MPVIENKYITQTHKYCPDGDWADGIELNDGQHYIVRDCIIDLSNTPVNEMDEAVSIIRGSSAEFCRCVIKGAGKLILCGSGDEEDIDKERNKSVTFLDCILEDFSRRGPEVQDGMNIVLNRCLIQNWCSENRFTVRGFGAWAHGEGSSIIANHVVFQQSKFFHKCFFQDLIGHIGQAINDGGWFKFFTKEAWQPGVCRGLVSTCGGKVSAYNCCKNKWWISIQNNSNPMNKKAADDIVKLLYDMKDNLYRRLESQIKE